MKLTTLAPAALLLLAGTAFAQDAATTNDSLERPANPTAQNAQTKPDGASASSQASEQGQESSRNSAAAARDYSLDASVHADFATADSDADGKLSVTELQAVMPDVTIVDTDADGYVSQAEAEASISGLAFESEGDGSEVIGESDYDTILSALDDDLDSDLDSDVDSDLDSDIEIETDAGPAVN